MAFSAQLLLDYSSAYSKNRVSRDAASAGFDNRHRLRES